MKRIKLLYRFLISINILFFILLIVVLTILVVPDFVYQKQYDDKTLGMYDHFIVLMRGILLFIGLFKIQQGLYAIIKNGFYNSISEIRFRKGGFFLILFGVSAIIFNIIIKRELELNVFITNFIQYFFIVLVGFGLYVLADFIKSGGILKQENDLTI